MKPENVHTLIGAYVLDALDDVERAAVERHLAGCQDCAAEVVELREVAARLGTLSAVAPPARLRERVLADVSQTRQVRPRTAPERQGQALIGWRRWTAIAIAACLVAVTAGVSTWSIQQQRVTAERAQTQAAEQRAEAVRRREARTAAVLAAPDALIRRVQASGGGRVTVVASARQDRMVVVLSELRQVPAGKAYQLWFIKDARPKSAGVLPPGATDATRLLSGFGDAELLGVTVEPAEGSRSPTTTPVVAVELR